MARDVSLKILACKHNILWFMNYKNYFTWKSMKKKKKIIVVDTHCYFVAKHIDWNVMIQTVKIRTLIWLLKRLHLKNFKHFSQIKKKFISLELVLQLNFLFISQFVLALKNSICLTKLVWVQGFIHCAVLDEQLGLIIL